MQDKFEIKYESYLKKDYTWHCPTKECLSKGVILMKTKSPFLGEGSVKCSECGKYHSFFAITCANKRNIKEFYELLK